jgi:DNA-binding transcriptional ArsR family regulator
MVEFTANLDWIFHSLTNPTRRQILAGSSKESRSTEIAERFAMSLAAVSKHLRVLEGAGMVSRAHEGRVHRMTFEAKPLIEAVSWFEDYRAFWDESFDILAGIVES